MITIGLDPSLTGCGWCVHDGGVCGSARVIAKGQYETTSKDLVYSRYIYLRSEISNLLCEYPQAMRVGVESPPFGESFSEGLYGLFLYVNEAILLARRDVVYFDPLRVKLLAKMDPTIRKGHMDKNDMVDAAKQDTGIKKWSHNEADAYIIARSAARFFDLFDHTISEESLTESERRVFLSKTTKTRGVNKGVTIGTGVLFKEGDRFYQFSKRSP
jgi:Holliday junction resolvasome RuvABC endonuclease subunit